MTLERKKILITGGTGFVGINLAMHLSKKGYEVVLLDIGDKLRRFELSGLKSQNKIKLIFHDLNHNLEFENENIDIIFHLAAWPHVDFSKYYPEKVINNNINSVLTIINFCLNRKIPLIFSSSVEVYGGDMDKTYSETDMLNALSPYSASKIAGESIIKSYIKTHNLQALIVRFTNLFGPWQAPDRIIPRLITQKLLSNKWEIEQGTYRDYLFIKDACVALEKLIYSQEFVGDIFNLSTGIAVDNKDIGEIISDCGKEINEINYRLPKNKDGRGKNLIISPTKIQNFIHWKNIYELKESIQETYDWYRENESWWIQFKYNIIQERNTANFIIDNNN